MSECVVRMEMPGRCIECPVRYICVPYVGFLFGNGEPPTPHVEGCNILVVLPENHGRLVDADAYDYPGDLKWEPTIVPAAERSEK